MSGHMVGPAGAPVVVLLGGLVGVGQREVPL